MNKSENGVQQQGCTPEVWASCFVNSINWIALPEGVELSKEPLRFGSLRLEVGQSVPKLGGKERTSFELAVPIRYCGMAKDGASTYAMFQPHEAFTQGRLFESYTWYIAFVLVSDKVMLMQTSPTGFYDIRP